MGLTSFVRRRTAPSHAERHDTDAFAGVPLLDKGSSPADMRSTHIQAQKVSAGDDPAPPFASSVAGAASLVARPGSADSSTIALHQPLAKPPFVGGNVGEPASRADALPRTPPERGFP